MSNTNPLLRPVVAPEAPSRKGAFGPGKTQMLYLPHLANAAPASSTPPHGAPSPAPSTPPHGASSPAPSTPPHAAPSPSGTLPLSAPPPVPREQLYPAAPGATMMFGSVLPAPPRPDAGVVTRFLPVEQLLSRAVEARSGAHVPAQPPAPPPGAFARFPELAPSHADIPLRIGLLGQLLRRFRSMSVVSRMSVAMLVLLAVVLLAGRLAKRAAAAPAVRASAAASAPVSSTGAARSPRSAAAPRVTPAGPLPPGLERRAADALAEGRDEAALALYRDLATRAPEQPAFREAVRLLERRKHDVVE